MSNTNPVLGIIGGGQLGSFLASSAKKLKIKTLVLTDDPVAPAKNFCDEIIFSDYSNKQKIEEFINKVDIVTYEFENIPFEVLNFISKTKKVLPSPEINRIVQNRNEEKKFVKNLGIKTTPWIFVNSKNDIKKNEDMLPGILKTCTLGYDGKGQRLINSLNEIDETWFDLNDYILEKKINLKQEISVILTRFKNDECYIYEPIENIHKNQILEKSKIPADIGEDIYKQSQNFAEEIAKKLNFVGTMCVEYFIDTKNNLMVNEIAPRVHNSGHLTLNAFELSQFDCHIRAVCGLKNLPNKKISNAEMINILGSDINNYKNRKYNNNEFFFDYLKKNIKDKRKMGHLTILK